MRRNLGWLVWLVLSIVIVALSILVGQISSPFQAGLSQCLDEITDYNICVVKNKYHQRFCCVEYPGNNWRAAYCLVTVYEQLRPPPLPPSIYYAERRLCGFPGDPCTPLVKLHCPTP